MRLNLLALSTSLFCLVSMGCESSGGGAGVATGTATAGSVTGGVTSTGGTNATDSTTGSDGVNGTTATTGTDSTTGGTGADGATGSTSTDSATGSTSTDSSTGASGADSTTGADASSGTDGTTGSSTPWPANVTFVDVNPDSTVSVTGDLSTGASVNLEFASLGEMACWPGTQDHHFKGNVVLYAASQPKGQDMTVTVTPTDKSTDVNVFAYQIGATNYAIPPDVTKSVSCEASYPTDGINHDPNPGVAETITLTENNPYNVVIGVAGHEGTMAGGYTLEISLTPEK